MPPIKKVIDRAIGESTQGRFVIVRFSNGDVVREPIIKKKPTRRPRLRRQKMMDRTRNKQF
jgi:hypothetical protein